MLNAVDLKLLHYFCSQRPANFNFNALAIFILLNLASQDFKVTFADTNSAGWSSGSSLGS